MPVSARSLIDSSHFNRYQVRGYSPKTVADFAGTIGGQEEYRIAGAITDFDTMFTYTGASNKTMTDSDGNLKWAPHNVIPNSTDGVNWTPTGTPTLTGSQSDPDGGTDAVLVAASSAADTKITATAHTVVAGPTYTVEVDAKYSAGSGWLLVFQSGATNTAVWFDVQNGAIGSSPGTSTSNRSITSIGDGWYTCKYDVVFSDSSSNFTFELASADNSSTAGASDAIYMHAPRIYRSDLGGMVDNPDRGDSYVPTTTAAVYQARRNSYRYNGSSYANKGITLESAAATNICTASNDLESWSGPNTTASNNQSTGPDGETSLASVTLQSTASAEKALNFEGTPETLSASTKYAVSAYVKYSNYAYLAFRMFGNTNHWASVVFNIQSGTVTQESTGATSGTIHDSGVEDVGGGIFRIWACMEVGDVAGSDRVNLFWPSSGTPTLNTNGSQTWTAAGTEVMYLGFCDVVASYALSSHIPTTGSTATRAAETLTIAGADFALDSDSGTIGIEAYCPSTIDNNALFVNCAGSGEDFSIGIYNANNATANYNGQVANASISAGDVKVFGSYDISGTEIKTCVDGGTVSKNSSITATTISAHNAVMGENATGIIRTFALIRHWPGTVLSDADMQDASS